MQVHFPGELLSSMEAPEITRCYPSVRKLQILLYQLFTMKHITYNDTAITSVNSFYNLYILIMESFVSLLFRFYIFINA